MKNYQQFIASKADRLRAGGVGIDVPDSDIHPALYPFQRAITRYALSMGRAAMFEDCGMGKTIQELEWATHVNAHTHKPVLIFAPLAVGPQMVSEGERINLEVHQCRKQADIRGTVNVTNYEMMRHFDPSLFGGLILDESSILKNQLGKVRSALIDFASHIPYRLAATATPSPNDLPELLNHAAYLGYMTVKEALALWFVQDHQVQEWRLRGHARAGFWQWVGSWAIAARSPSDLGMPMDGYDLSPLIPIPHVLSSGMDSENGVLFPMAVGIQEVRRSRRDSLDDRVKECASLVNAVDEPWIVWCELNAESDALAKAIPDAVEIRGSDSIERKTRALVDFSQGNTRVLVTKPSIAGHGLNWQHCARMAFIGVSYSFESRYQAIRRCWRYGQQRPVEVHQYMTDADQFVVDSVQQKEDGAMDLYDNIPWQVGSEFFRKPYAAADETAEGDGWAIHLGDSVETMSRIEDESVGLSVFSPPFPGMYVYTDSPHDMGNVQSISEMVGQFRYLVDKDHMMRVMMPGRSMFVHITQGVAQLGRDGYIGLRDFRGEIIRMMNDEGWIYYGEVTIDKNPQIKAIRTKDAGLMFKSLSNDAARMHPALSDMLLQFRKPGDNPVPIHAGQSHKYGNMAGWVTAEDWILWARPVWYAADFKPQGLEQIAGIQETDVLNVSAARSEEDERHLCPLQLGVIERCVKVWSNPGETVYSPFAGVGSEGVVALQQGRQFVGGELKREYFDVARRNLAEACSQMDMF